jgi:hypothetical protein
MNMSIISRRIPYGLGYIPGRGLRAHTVRGGMGGAENCGPNQQWDPNFVYAGIKGQCTPRGSAMAPKPGVDWGSIANTLTSALTPKPAAPTGLMPGYPPAASTGMSKGTMIAIGLGAVGLLAVVMLTRK